MNFLDKFSKNYKIPDLVKIRPIGAKLFHAEGQTERQTEVSKLVVAFRSFANAPKKNNTGILLTFKYLLLREYRLV